MTDKVQKDHVNESNTIITALQSWGLYSTCCLSVSFLQQPPPRFFVYTNCHYTGCSINHNVPYVLLSNFSLSTFNVENVVMNSLNNISKLSATSYVVSCHVLSSCSHYQATKWSDRHSQAKYFLPFQMTCRHVGDRIKTHHITVSSITLHRLNNFNSQNFNHYPF